MKKVLFLAALLLIAFACQKEREPQNELKSSKLTQPWLKCANGHYTIGSCGTVFDPPYGKCQTCGADIVDHGAEVCGEG